MFECVHVLNSCTNLIVSDTLVISLMIEKNKVYRNVTDVVCVILIVDVYVMLSMHVMLFLSYTKEGAGGSR